ncbi:MAG: hypothetical protein JWQ11_4870 [Rhizobacter sp.]|nr:hypothetical protein [Rhizobacter sp.]
MPRSRSSHSLLPAWLVASRETTTHVFMALVLLLAQTQATLHWLSHSTAAVQDAVRTAQADAKASRPSERSFGHAPSDASAALAGFTTDHTTAPRGDPGFDLSCDKCASIASLAAMLHSNAFQLTLEEGSDAQVAALAWASAERIVRLGYLSRAPPTAG